MKYFSLVLIMGLSYDVWSIGYNAPGSRQQSTSQANKPVMDQGQAFLAELKKHQSNKALDQKLMAELETAAKQIEEHEKSIDAHNVKVRAHQETYGKVQSVNDIYKDEYFKNAEKPWFREDKGAKLAFGPNELNKVAESSKKYYEALCSGESAKDKNCTKLKAQLEKIESKNGKSHPNGLNAEKDISDYRDALSGFKKSTGTLLFYKEEALSWAADDLNSKASNMTKTRLKLDETHKSLQNKNVAPPDSNESDLQDLVGKMVKKSEDQLFDTKLLMMDAKYLELKTGMAKDDAEKAFEVLIQQASAQLDQTMLGKYVEAKVAKALEKIQTDVDAKFANSLNQVASNVEEQICQPERIGACASGAVNFSEQARRGLKDEIKSELKEERKANRAAKK